MAAAKDIVVKLLSNATNPAIVEETVAAEATYVSLNQHNPDLTAIEGTAQPFLKDMVANSWRSK